MSKQVRPADVDANRWAVACPVCFARPTEPCLQVKRGKVTGVARRTTHGFRLAAVRRMLEGA